MVDLGYEPIMGKSPHCHPFSPYCPPCPPNRLATRSPDRAPRHPAHPTALILKFSRSGFTRPTATHPTTATTFTLRFLRLHQQV